MRLTNKEYDDFVYNCNNPNIIDDTDWAVTSLMSELGEACQIREKYLRKRNMSHEEYIRSMQDEICDILWNVVNLGRHYGLSLDDMINRNHAKLVKRHAN